LETITRNGSHEEKARKNRKNESKKEDHGIISFSSEFYEKEDEEESLQSKRNQKKYKQKQIPCQSRRNPQQRWLTCRRSDGKVKKSRSL
jgi:hypothetical protein